MADKKQYTKAVTPTGRAAYAWLAKPDEGGTYSDGKYKATLVLDEDADLGPLRELCEKVAKESHPADKLDDVVYPFRDGDDKDKEEFAGKTLITAKSKYKPGCFGAGNKALPESVQVRSGDDVKLSVTILPYTSTENETVTDPKTGKKKKKTTTVYGISLQLRAVKLIAKNNTGGFGGGDDFDDDDDEGYEVPESDDDSSGSQGESSGGDGDF